MKTKLRAREKRVYTVAKEEAETLVTSRFLPLAGELTEAVTTTTTSQLTNLHHFEDEDLPPGSRGYGVNLEQV